MKLLITIDKGRHHVIEHYVKKLGGGANKSGVIRDALDLFFKTKYGFKYNSIKNEVDERNS